MSDLSEEEQETIKKNGKTFLDIQRKTIEKLMNDPQKEVFIPEFKKDEKKPRAFFTHEFVRNVMGASAGAGSGEFDIYRGCRHREMIRQEYLQEKSDQEKARKEFEEKRELNLTEAEIKTAKKRAKRLKVKSNLKNKKKTSKLSNEQREDEEEEEIEIDLDEKIESEKVEELDDLSAVNKA